jgi:hypothetical protein
MPAKPGAAESAFDQFLAAERAQESGGNYGVVNAIGAAGAYQIMGYHIPDWSRAALGHSISEHEFLTHPAEQDAIARFEFKPIYDKYGPRGAAAWWYSGSAKLANDYRPQKNGPSIGAYVDQVLGRIGKAGSVTGGTTGGSSATPADDVSGSAVHTAGLQQAGYDAQIKLDSFGIPLNPFKLPGWLDGALSGGVEAYGGEAGKALGGAVGGLAGGMWDAVGPLILSGIGVAAGAGIVLLGLYVTAKPAITKTTEAVQQTAQTAATVAPLAA